MIPNVPRTVQRNSHLRIPAAAYAALTTVLVLAAAVFGQSPAHAAQHPVGLGTAASYSVLGGQAVTNTGPTTLGGDLGVSPGTAITGFPPGLVAGAVHAGDAQAAQAQADLVVAYDDAAGRAPTASVAGDLVGRTLLPGVYNSTGPLAVSGALTLNGQGNFNSVFIFQVASTLTTASASSIVLTNGAQACNIFWQVGSSATLGTASTFRGTIMALTSISVTTGTTVEGRALARNGQVSLDTNVFTAPGCAAGPPAPAPTTPPVVPGPTTPPVAPGPTTPPVAPGTSATPGAPGPSALGQGTPPPGASPVPGNDVPGTGSADGTGGINGVGSGRNPGLNVDGAARTTAGRTPELLIGAALIAGISGLGVVAGARRVRTRRRNG